MYDWLIFIALLIGAYLLGSIPLAYLIPKWTRGIDLREYGSGNVGFTNVAASTSKWLAIPVLVFDIGKGALAVLAARWLGFSLPLQGIIGIAAITGHNWPVFLKFNAGRGLLTTIGVVVALVPKAGVVLTLIALLGIPFHILALTSMICVFLISLVSWFSTIPPFDWLIGTSLVNDSLSMALVFFAIWLLMSIRRLTVPYSSLANTVSTGQLIVNRLLFDRDIRDRKAWLNRTPAGESQKK
jgi:acyl phosphate:glycerol-3-phosphate acyltransferase